MFSVPKVYNGFVSRFSKEWVSVHECYPLSPSYMWMDFDHKENSTFPWKYCGLFCSVLSVRIDSAIRWNFQMLPSLHISLLNVANKSVLRWQKPIYDHTLKIGFSFDLFVLFSLKYSEYSPKILGLKKKTNQTFSPWITGSLHASSFWVVESFFEEQSNLISCRIPSDNVELVLE